MQWITQTLLRVGIALVGLRLTLHGLTTLGVLAIRSSRVVSWPHWLPVRSWVVVEDRRTPCVPSLRGNGGVWLHGSSRRCTGRTGETRRNGTGADLRRSFRLIGDAGLSMARARIARLAWQAAGIFLGTAIHDTSQVIGASLSMHSSSARLRRWRRPALPSCCGICRCSCWCRCWAACVASALNLFKTERSLALARGAAGFLIGFLLCALARSIGDALFLGSPVADAWWQGTIAFGLAAPELFLVCGMAAVGLSVSLKHVRDLGWRAPLAAFLVALSVAPVSLGLTVCVVAWL